MQTLTQKKKYTYMNFGLLVLLFVFIFLADRFLPSYDVKAKVLQKGAVFALIAVSMNLLNGFTGLFSLGQAGFMLLGAYTYAIFTIPTVADRVAVYKYYTTTAADGTVQGGLVQFALPVAVAIILAGLVAALFAFLIGLPVLRLKSDYLAIATLGFAEILRALCQWKGLGVLTNGSNQLRLYPTFSGILPYFLVAGICIAVIALLIRSTYGRAFKAIRDDEVAAEAMGINLTKHKMIAFVVSSFFAGIGGASHEGVLIKGSNYLETLSKTKVVVFDNATGVGHRNSDGTVTQTRLFSLFCAHYGFEPRFCNPVCVCQIEAVQNGVSIHPEPATTN